MDDAKRHAIVGQINVIRRWCLHQCAITVFEKERNARKKEAQMSHESRAAGELWKMRHPPTLGAALTSAARQLGGQQRGAGCWLDELQARACN